MGITTFHPPAARTVAAAIVRAGLALASLAVWSPADARAESVAFFYGRDVPVEMLKVYRRIVVQPDTAGDVAHLSRFGARIFGYVSVGELAAGAPRPPGFHASWVIARNVAWGTAVIDLTKRGWVDHVVEGIIAPLWQHGYRGFFLDTLDSYELAGLPAADKRGQIDALVRLLWRVHRRFPGVELIVNRGFDVLPRVAPLVTAVVAESLYDGWDPGQRRYVRVPEPNRLWLLDRLADVVADHRLPVTIIDYRPESERDQARETARRIDALGYDPWVTNANLTMVGVGDPEIAPRRILMLFDGAQEPVQQSAVVRLLAPILEYEGYVPVARDVRLPLPAGPLAGRYAGLVSWFSGPVDEADRYRLWLLGALDGGARIAILGHLGFAADREARRRLGLKQVTGSPSGALRVRSSAMVGFEAPPRAHRAVVGGLVANAPDARVHLRVEDAAGPRSDPVVTTTWGGVALQPHLVEVGYAGALSWVIDPFAFLREALALEPIPAPDVTTENGSRLLMVHVDLAGADQRAELRGAPRVGEVVARLVDAHRVPHSTSGPPLARRLAHVAAAAPDDRPIGAGASLTRADPSVTRLTPNARPDATGALRIEAPIADEDGYRVDDGGAPFGFRRVIETLELTDAVRRLKPIGLRYHAVTARTPAGLAALRAIYGWIERRDTLPVYGREYRDKVRDGYRLALARNLDGSFALHGLGALRTVRVPRELGWPDLARSPAVVAVRDLPQGRYVSFGPGERARLALAETPSRAPILVRANARVVRFEVLRSGVIRLHLRGHVPVSFTVAGLAGARCAWIGNAGRTGKAGTAGRVPGRPVATTPDASSGGDGTPRATRASWTRFDLPVADTGRSRLECR